MKRKKTTKKETIMAVMLFSVLCFLCSASSAAMPGKGKAVRPCYNGIIEELFQLLIVNKGLEELGYNVQTPLELEITAMHMAVGQGDADYNANSWIPLHNTFFEKVGGADKVTRIGTLVEGAVQGYLVDKKTAEKQDIKTINDLADPQIAKVFDTNGDGSADLTGCNPGWGCELTIEHHLDAYNLRTTVTHNQGSYFALMADTIARYKAGKPILYYTWAPQWVGGVLVPGRDVVWLEVTHTDLPKGQEDANTKMADGKNLGFSVNSIHVFANNTFLQENPAAKKFFEIAKIPIDDIAAQNLKMRDGEKKAKDIERHASDWITNNKTIFDQWISEATAVKKKFILMGAGVDTQPASTINDQSTSGIASNPVIECRSLWKIYGEHAQEALAAIQEEDLTKEEVLERFGCGVGVVDASFSVDEGEIFCIMGLSGSGKSTLVRHINRLIDPTAGSVLIEDKDITAMSMAEPRQTRSEKIGMVFQNMALLPHKNVRQNVALSLELRGIDREARNTVAEKSLETVQLSEWGNCYPDELSGGMQQRVGLARALAADPQILLMDEPFSALDPLIRRQLQEQFLKLSTAMKKTTLFITHDLDEAIRIGNRIAKMKDGALVQIGSPEDIVTQPADAYVADFVAGISRLHLVYAHTVMWSIGYFESKYPGVVLEQCPSSHPDADLDSLIDTMVSTGEKFITIIESGKCVGVVTQGGLLRGIQGKELDED